jgi:hypothetical protein
MIWLPIRSASRGKTTSIVPVTATAPQFKHRSRRRRKPYSAHCSSLSASQIFATNSYRFFETDLFATILLTKVCLSYRRWH